MGTAEGAGQRPTRAYSSNARLPAGINCESGCRGGGESSTPAALITPSRLLERLWAEAHDRVVGLSVIAQEAMNTKARPCSSFHSVLTLFGLKLKDLVALFRKTAASVVWVKSV